ncbi:unnamed protein product [Phytomonas sp. Hart1]|nr:unnamed protein product [Phytomonas sp. Hart1]|eukprot:CCW72312.1 unnamed protein product [Phytomonas sp. isolate Hart1]
MLSETSLREFYEHVFPVELITTWLAYDLSSNDPAEHPDKVDSINKSNGNVPMNAAAYLARREFCFTLRGDIFTRFRSFLNAQELREELIKCSPEKIDVGGVYNIRPNSKQSFVNISPQERELVFDIDMSDYDSVRSCCSGKAICLYCWEWVACAINVLRKVLSEDFGFKHMLPVFSGRRGVHLWVCDKRARKMRNDERAALVGYLAVVETKITKGSVIDDLVNYHKIHPTIEGIYEECIKKSFEKLFIGSNMNPNNMEHNPRSASVVMNAMKKVLTMNRKTLLIDFMRKINFEEGGVLELNDIKRALKNEDEAHPIICAAQLFLMYPRLDEHVTTRRDHLLKLPFCVHAGTGSLCCPLDWETLSSFDPLKDSPNLENMILNRSYNHKFEGPLRKMLNDMQNDPDEI